MPTLEATGTVASAGYAQGPLFRIDEDEAGYRPSGNADTEAERLRSAIRSAGAALAQLVASSEAESAAILEFQVAMLEDESLSEPAFVAIAAGEDAASAWTGALAAQIADYEAAEDAYFRARSADLRDLRESVLRALTGREARNAPAGAILYGRDITPTQFLAVNWKAGGGIVLRQGSPASHVAMLARSRGVPMLVGVDLEAANDDLVLVDAEHGRVTVRPDSRATDRFRSASGAHARSLQSAQDRIAAPAVTAAGDRVLVLVNIAAPEEVDSLAIDTCDGVGLMRTEFLFTGGLPTEDAQYEAYRRVVEWAAGKPVTIRTVDAGGDKPVPGYTIDETNPFLGLRGIRLSLSRPEVFRSQVRALLRSAVHGQLKVMFPMISVAAEYRAAVLMFEEEARRLAAAGMPHRLPPLGIMVEVPAVAIHPTPFRGVAFLSIGSNDLTQYVMAAGRDSSAVGPLNDVRHPAVMSLIRDVVRFGSDHAIEVSLCGDAGGDPAAIPLLVAAGLRALSVAPAQLAVAKAAIARAGVADASHVAG